VPHRHGDRRHLGRPHPAPGPPRRRVVEYRRPVLRQARVRPVAPAARVRHVPAATTRSASRAAGPHRVVVRRRRACLGRTRPPCRRGLAPHRWAARGPIRRRCRRSVPAVPVSALPVRAVALADREASVAALVAGLAPVRAVPVAVASAAAVLAVAPAPAPATGVVPVAVARVVATAVGLAAARVVPLPARLPAVREVVAGADPVAAPVVPVAPSAVAVASPRAASPSARSGRSSTTSPRQR
jgi:hypothetical protein